MRHRIAALAGLSLLLAAPVAAQQSVYVRAASPAWLGVSYELRWVQQDGSCTPRVVVDAVVQGSPAERAGLRAGDAILSVDGDPIPGGRLQAIAARLAPGDSVRLQLLRDGSTREVVAVADRRPDRPLSILVERRTGLEASTAPLIEVVGDTLIARNVGGERSTGPVRGYWVSQGDGKAEYRTISGWARSDLDRRVEELLTCADSAQWEGVSWHEAIPTDLQRIQQRADSLRVVITRRTLERGESGVLRAMPTPEASEPGTFGFYLPDGAFEFRVEDHVAVGLRGVAGAELTTLEPELAEYFRNVERGLLVLRVSPGTPAAEAGLVPGDVVTAADGRRIESVTELRRILALPGAGGVELRVVRTGRVVDLRVRRD